MICVGGKSNVKNTIYVGENPNAGKEQVWVGTSPLRPNIPKIHKGNAPVVSSFS